MCKLSQEFFWSNVDVRPLLHHIRCYLPCRGKSLLSSSLKLWVGMLKAACLRACGNASPTIEQMTQMPPTDPVRTCARSLVNILVRLAEAYETLETPDLAESALRQALEVCRFCNRLLGSYCCFLKFVFLASTTQQLL